MRILSVTQYFYPEVFKSNDLAFELVKRGHQVDALVGISVVADLEGPCHGHLAASAADRVYAFPSWE